MKTLRKAISRINIFFALFVLGYMAVFTAGIMSGGSYTQQISKTLETSHTVASALNDIQPGG
tara:strand:+ start:271 stop:456 length:186 start_codon:yes stop_codon:yes gene_type:complete